jgi:1,4-alpha-glucan branching enzyme
MVLACAATIAQAQTTLDVTFRYVENPVDNFVRAFVPGTMPPGSSQDWGPNSASRIDPNAPSRMEFNANVDAYVRSYTVTIGARHEYKIHFHFNDSGSEWQWISDPLNLETTGPDANSVIQITDPLLFQPALHLTEQNSVTGMSAGIFTNGNIEEIRYYVGSDTMDGTGNIDSNGVFYVPFSPAQNSTRGFGIIATIDGQTYSVFEQIVEPRPQNARPGVNVTSTGAIFVVHAPFQSMMMKVLINSPGIIPDISEAISMKKAAGEVDWWWVEVDLSPGQYEYEYLLLGGTLVEDPISRRIQNGRTAFDVGAGGASTADDYIWQSDDYVRPALDTLVIYELHIDDFSAQGSAQGRFTDLMAKLDYLDSLGINAIELMPIMEFPGSRSWGYNTRHYAAVESTYGSPRDFKRLVDEAHLRGIAIILDIVWNHVDGIGPLWRIQPNYSLNPYLKTVNEVRPNETILSFGGRDLDHFTVETQRYVNEVHRIWVEEYRVDGFRFDFTRGIGWTTGQPQFGILGWSTKLRQLDAAVYQIAEHLAADPNLIDISDLDAGWHDSFHDRLLNDVHQNPTPSMPTVEAQVLRLREYHNNGAEYAMRTAAVKATVTHDEQSLIQEMVRFKGVQLETALKRDLVYSTLTFTALGVPMIWQAQELGMQSGWFDDNGNGNWDDEKLGYRPFDWSLLETERGQRHLDLYKRLIQLRKQNPALYRGVLRVLFRNSSQRVIAYGYRDEAPESTGDEVMVVANLSSAQRTVANLPWMSTGIWYDVLSDGESMQVDSDTLDSFTISSYTARVYTNKMITSVLEGSKGHLPTGFRLYQNYPNPFNPSTTIRFEVAKKSNVRLRIYDLLGREIHTLVDEAMEPGNYIVRWDGMNDFGLEASSGVYIIRMSAGDFSQSMKLIKLK